MAKVKLKAILKNTKYPAYEVSFASDNWSGAHPLVFASLEKSNSGLFPAYGADGITATAIAKIRKNFGPETQPFFVFNGTGANVLALAAMAKSTDAIFCARSSHLENDESAAPEKFIGCKLHLLDCPDGKIKPEQMKPVLSDKGNPHRAQPRVLSISQPTELGTVYSLDEIRNLSRFTKKHGLYLHMDGARLSNAVDFLDCELRDTTFACGVDAVSFGGSKNGLLFGEAVIFANASLAVGFENLRKQGLQLFSKMRFISAQFSAYLEKNLWKKNAGHSNRMAKRLALQLKNHPLVKITQAVETNALFAKFPKKFIGPLQDKFPFYVWNEETSEVRWMCSFNTRPKDVDALAQLIWKVVK